MIDTVAQGSGWREKRVAFYGQIWRDILRVAPTAVMLRGPAELQPLHNSNGGDLDLLLGQGIEPVRRILRERGFYQAYTAQPWIEQYVLLTTEAQPFVIDGYRQQYWGAGLCLGSSAAPVAQVLAPLLRAVFDKREPLRFAAARDAATAALREAGGDWPVFAELLLSASQQSCAALLRRKGIVVRDWRMASRILARCAAFRLMQLLRRNGLEVGLIGVDGTGKSTLSSGLAGTSLPVRAIYMGDNQFTSWPMKLVRRRRLPWPLPVLAMHYELLRRRLRGRCLARRGYIVVYDRHPAERSEPFPSGFKQRLNRWLARGYDGAVDLTFYLTGDFDVLFRRKGEARAAQLREMDARLRSILQQRRISYEQIDATLADTPEVLRQVADAVIAAYVARADIQRLPSPLRQVLAGATPVALRNDSDRY